MAIARCLDTIDYISDAALHIVINLIEYNSCPEAKRFLVTRPEELAVRSFEKAIKDISQNARRRGELSH